MHLRTLMFAGLCAIPAMSLAAQDEPTPDVPALYVTSPAVEEADLDPEAELLAELAYVAQELGVPVPLPGGPVYETPKDYPPAAWAAGQEGKTGIAVPVDVNGKPTACKVTESSGSDLLDAKTCELVMERGAFQPALNEDGTPFAAVYQGSYRWRRAAPHVRASRVLSVAYTITAGGDVVDCEVKEFSGEFSEYEMERLENSPCPQSSFVEGRVYRDGEGNPVSKRLIISSSISIADPE